MRYFRERKDNGSVEEITRQKAAWLLNGAYKDDAIFEMLNTAGEYPTMYSVIKVVEN